MKYIELEYGKYQAHISAELGGNVIYFYDQQQKREILIGSHNQAEIEANPSCYGMPLLLPPNRIAEGKFSYEGRNYQFPINEPARQNHLHGFFRLVKYQVAQQENLEDKQVVVLEYQFTEKDSNFQYFPHQLNITKRYELSDNGLALIMTIENQSKQRIPMMFAFHTAFPLMENIEKSKEMNVRLSVNARVELDENLRATENYVSGDKIASTAAEVGFSPLEEELDNVYKVKTFGFKGAIIKYPEYQAQTVYEVDDIFHYLVVWNEKASGKILCIEPQTYRNNGINLPSWQEDGINLESGEAITIKTNVSSQ